MRRVFQPKRARLLERCAPWERFLAHTAGPFPPTLPTAATIAIRTPPLPPSPGETLRPRGFSHRRRDAKSLIYFRGLLPPLRPINPQPSTEGATHVLAPGQRVLHRLSGHCSPASRLSAPRRRPSGPAGSGHEPTLPRWLLFDADTRIGKERAESDLDDRPLSISMAPNRAILTAKTIRLSSLAAARPFTRDHSLSQSAGSLQRQWLQACSAISRNAYSLTHDPFRTRRKPRGFQPAGLSAGVRTSACAFLAHTVRLVFFACFFSFFFLFSFFLSLFFSFFSFFLLFPFLFFFLFFLFSFFSFFFSFSLFLFLSLLFFFFSLLFLSFFLLFFFFLFFFLFLLFFFFPLVFLPASL